jgi:hypothetical protein
MSHFMLTRSTLCAFYAYQLGWEIRGFRSFFLAEFSDSDSDRKVGSRHFFNIPESIPAINVPIFFRGKLFPPFFPQVRGEARKGHLLHIDPPKGHLLVSSKKATSREMFFRREAPGRGRLTATTTMTMTTMTTTATTTTTTMTTMTTTAMTTTATATATGARLGGVAARRRRGGANRASSVCGTASFPRERVRILDYLRK